MPLNIKDPETHDAARELADLTNTSITAAVSRAVKDALERERVRRQAETKRLIATLDDIATHCASLPVLDSRTPDEILGYGEHGLPG